VFASFQRHDVRYLVIGGIAAVLHGVPRATFDLDILIEASPENARLLLSALTEAQFATATLITAEELLAHEITIFTDRVRIDVQTSTPGIKFEEAWRRRVTMTYQGREFYVAAREDVIASKRAAGRDKDLEDVRMLEIDSASGDAER
jgi:tRNA nucleotidyltransferase/poly(A) polymerase